MAVARSLAVDGRLEAEVLDDHAGAEIEVVLHDLQQLLRRVLGRPVVEDADAGRLSYTNGVGYLRGVWLVMTPTEVFVECVY